MPNTKRPKGPDRRYASGRIAAEQKAFYNPPPPILYRADRLRNAKSKRGRGETLRDIADRTRLSVNTVRDALDGFASKIETLKILADYYGIPWIALFDTEYRLTLEYVPNRPRNDDEGSGLIDLNPGWSWLITKADMDIYRDQFSDNAGDDVGGPNAGEGVVKPAKRKGK